MTVQCSYKRYYTLELQDIYQAGTEVKALSLLANFIVLEVSMYTTKGRKVINRLHSAANLAFPEKLTGVAPYYGNNQPNSDEI